jgi:hypothetical protein
MLNMSFYNGTLNRNIAKKIINETEKSLAYRYGFGWKGADKNPITKERALKIIDTESYLDITETETEILLNAYSSNDMW